VDLDGSYSAYNLSSFSLGSGTIAPRLMSASRYCEARYAVNHVFNSWKNIHVSEVDKPL
jgi:hypothetical protein